MCKYIEFDFKATQPCNNCPYRKDAPLQLWDRYEFTKLLAQDKLQFGSIYGCHKNNGNVCVGWLMNQDERGFPNLNLRIKLSNENITHEYLDSLHCKSERYKSIEEMVKANFPELLNQ